MLRAQSFTLWVKCCISRASIGTTINGNKGEKLSIVQMFYEMKTPVEAKIYDYFEG